MRTGYGVGSALAADSSSGRLLIRPNLVATAAVGDIYNVAWKSASETEILGFNI